jgi:hypothetical protein
MYRNTYILLIFLAVFAAIVAGVNLTRGPEQAQPVQPSLPTPTAQPAQPALYQLAGCGIAFPTQKNHTALEGPGNNVVFTAKTGSDTIIVTCQKNIPRPALTADNIEKLAFDLPNQKPTTIAANLYHDASAKDGTPVDKLIFNHPVNGLDVFISGYGDTFQALIRQLSILR